MRNRRGFTLIEILIALAILLVLLAMVYSQLGGMIGVAKTQTMAATVRLVRQQIAFHAAIRDVEVSQEGYPNAIDPEWFSDYRLPRSVWAGRPLKVQVVHGAKQARVPNNKTFNSSGLGSGDHTAWYNAANGSFCVLVPQRGTKDEILEMFLAANGLTEADLDPDD